MVETKNLTVMEPSAGRSKPPKKYKQAKSESRLSVQAQGSSATPQPGSRISETEPLAVEPGQTLPTSSAQQELKRIENNILNTLNARLDRSLQQFADRQSAKADKERQEREKADRDRHQRFLASVTQTINGALNSIPQQVYSLLS